MPYARNSELPESVKNVLPTHAQDVFRRVFNQQSNNGADEQRSFQVAWVAVRNGWEKNAKTGQWHRKVDAAAFAGGCVQCGWGTKEIHSALDICAFCSDAGAETDAIDDSLEAEASYQTRGGVKFHKGDFFYTPSDDASTWKLLKSGTPGGAPDAAHVGAAVAALGKGFRGKKVSIPQDARAGVKAKVRAAWKKLHPDATPAELPAVLHASITRDMAAEHSFSTVQLALDDAAVSVVRRAAATLIQPEDVHTDEGLEPYPHVTVLYGLETQDVADIIPIVHGLAVTESMEAIIQGLEIFSPDGKDYDVVVHRIACPGACQLHESLAETLPHATTHPVYKPHMTLGYVRRGAGGQYASLQTGLEGMVLTFPACEFNTSDDICTTIPFVQAMHGEVFALEAMGVYLPAVEEHPNRLPFEGVLTRIDEPSDRAPAGAKGHRVLMPRATAEAALPSLIGMGVDSEATLEGHNPQRKIGVITEAWLSGQDVCVRGILYVRDFPQEVARIQALARQGLMGMSFELAAADIDDPNATVWRLLRCTFTGAAILKRAHAAYRATALAAQGKGQGGTMDGETIVPAALTVNIAASAEEIATLQANMDSLMQTMQTMGGQMEHYQACMTAMSHAVGMRAEMDSLVEALEHLVKMHNALHQMGPQDVEGAATHVAAEEEGEPMDAETKERLAAMEAAQVTLLASMKLLTDGQQEIRGLLTDRQQGANGLLTDGQGRMTAATRTVPQRKTLHAQGEYEQCVAKYGLEANRGYNEREVDGILKSAGITDTEKRLAVKLEMAACGIMQR